MATVKMLRVELEVSAQEVTDILGQMMGQNLGEIGAPATATTTAALPAPEKPKRGRPPSQPGDDSIRGRILEVIEQRPMSSIQLQNVTKLEMEQITGSCAKLKDAGRIVQKIHQHDGTRYWMTPQQAEKFPGK